MDKNISLFLVTYQLSYSEKKIIQSANEIVVFTFSSEKWQEKVKISNYDQNIDKFLQM